MLRAYDSLKSFPKKLNRLLWGGILFKTAFLFVLFSITISFSNELTLEESNEVFSIQASIFRQHDGLLETENQRRKDAKMMSSEPIRLPRKQVPKMLEEEGDGYLFYIHTIRLEGVTKLSRHEQYYLTRPYVGFMGGSHIKQLLADIQNMYIRRGYTTTKPYPKPGQDVTTGELVIQVDEGRISRIEDSNGKKNMALIMAFPFLEGKVLNIRDIEQGLDQMNRLASHRVKVNFIPQKKSEGYGTLVQVVNNVDTSKLYAVSIAYTNETFPRFRMYPQSIRISRDQLLQVNDQWQVSFSQDNGEIGQNSNSAALGVSIPFGYSLFSYGYSRFENHMLIKGNFQIFSLKGRSEGHTFGVNHTLFRNQTAKTQLTVQLKRTDLKSFIEDAVNDAGTRIITVADLGVNHIVYGEVTWVLGINYHRGLRFWGAPRDSSTIAPLEPQFQFEKTTFSGNIYSQFLLMQVPILYKASGRFQFSRNTLFPSEQLTMGGGNSVRGFSSSVSGPLGVVIQQDASIPLRWSPLVRMGLAGLHLIAGLDIGSVRPMGQLLWERMAGAMLGIRHSGPRITSEVMIAHPLRGSGEYARNTSLFYWNVNVKLV
jgi:hemolysin activation/secretion protein